MRINYFLFFKCKYVLQQKLQDQPKRLPISEKHLRFIYLMFHCIDAWRRSFDLNIPYKCVAIWAQSSDDPILLRGFCACRCPASKQNIHLNSPVRQFTLLSFCNSPKYFHLFDCLVVPPVNQRLRHQHPANRPVKCGYVSRSHAETNAVPAVNTSTPILLGNWSLRIFWFDRRWIVISLCSAKLHLCCKRIETDSLFAFWLREEIACYLRICEIAWSWLKALWCRLNRAEWKWFDAFGWIVRLWWDAVADDWVATVQCDPEMQKANELGNLQTTKIGLVWFEFLPTVQFFAIRERAAVRQQYEDDSTFADIEISDERFVSIRSAQ